MRRPRRGSRSSPPSPSLRELRLLVSYIATNPDARDALDGTHPHRECAPVRIIERIGDHLERLLGGLRGIAGAPALTAAEAA